ncbi:MAG TPA: IgGFc-binding protein, partial [Pseudomonadota bacterium]|nr:IgGFc-binding protein [Pseudomonadota bacterium]
SYTYNAEHMTFPPQGAGLLAVMALTDDTMVEVTPPVATAKGPGVPALRAGETVRRLLKRLEVMEIVQANSREDISGAVVKASAPVVVYGGAGGVTIPASAVGGNHLGVQMFPLETWGKRYVGAKVKQRNLSDKDYYRIVASVDNTNVTIKSTTMLPAVPPLSKGQIYEFATDADFVVESDQPILVFQYMPAWGNLTGRYDPKEFPSGVSARCPFIGTADDVKCLGDANITPLVPVEQYRNDYIFYVPQTYSYDFINVTAAPDAKLSLDGQAITTPFRGIADGTIGRMIIRIEKPGNHRITSTKPFGLLGYGYAYATSYSYAGGLNLDKINPIE